MIKKLALLWCLIPLVVNAAETSNPAASGWKGEGELGFTSTSGNTDSSNLSTSLGLTYQNAPWKHAISLDTLRAKADGVKSADSLVAKERSEYSLNQKDYLFGQARYEEDEFSGFDYQASIAFGYGSRFIETDIQLLDASAGLGYRQLKESESGDTEGGPIVTADLVFEHKISESATFIERILLETGSDNTFIESETALKTRINGNMSAKISYLLKRNSDVPDGTKKRDTVVSASLVYGF